MIQILQGDCLKVLPTLEAKSVQCCVTSPPYWGLRDYGCGGQLGLEATLQEYVAKMVGVFREVWRVLKDDGTLWVNMGDSYNANQGNDFDTHKDGGIRKALSASPKVSSGLRPKNLVGIPWRLAFSLQADGWTLRSDIIWAKPNPMPESVTDRPTKSHEYIFLLSKRERYFYDADAIREPFQHDSRDERWGTTSCTRFNDHTKDLEQGLQQTKPPGFVRMSNPKGSNKRTVWTVATQPYAEAHFATFPEDLVKPCILAGSRVGDTVLDPFGGSGTTGMVSLELGRKAILIELNPKYCEMAEDRCNVTVGML